MQGAIRLAVVLGLGALTMSAHVTQSLAQAPSPGPRPEIAIGREDAPVTLVEYADLSCSACADFHAKVLPGLKEKHVDAGKVRFLFRVFPNNRNSAVAVTTVHCAGSDKAFPLLTTLFQHQDEWRQTPSFDVLREKLFALSQLVGLTREAFDRCVPTMKDGRVEVTAAQEKRSADIVSLREHALKELGIDTLPTSFISGRRVAGATLPAFEAAIAAALNP